MLYRATGPRESRGICLAFSSPLSSLERPAMSVNATEVHTLQIVIMQMGVGFLFYGTLPSLGAPLLC